MQARAQRLLVLLFTTAFTALGHAGPAAAQTQVTSDPEGVAGFTLQESHLTWWQEGRCGGEFPRTGTVRHLVADTTFVRELSRGCDVSPFPTRAVRSGSSVYYVEDLEIVRKPSSGGEGTSSIPVSTAPFTPPLLHDAGTPLVAFEDDLYWTRFDPGTGRVVIQRTAIDGSSTVGLVQVLNASAPRELEVVRYTVGSNEFLAIAWLENDGTLRVHRRSSGGAATTILATNVIDFALHKTSAFVIPTGQVDTVYAYAAIGTETPGPSSPPGRLDRIHIVTGSAFTLYTSAGNNQVLSVATDSDGLGTQLRNVYIDEAFYTCGFLCSITERVQYRRAISGGIVSAWIQYLNTGGGSDLASDDEFVYWTNGQIMKISTQAPPVQTDFEAVGVEAVQNVQSLDMDVSLVAGKRTYARGYASMPIATGQKKEFGISAELHGFRGGQPLPGSPLWSENPATVNPGVSLGDARGSLGQSFLWELPESWTTQGSISLTMVVDPSQSLPETETLANNTATTSADALFMPPIRPCIQMRPVDVQGAPLWSPDAAGEDIPAMQIRATSLLPIVGTQLDWFPSVLQDQVYEPSVEAVPCPIPPFVCYVPIVVSNYYPFVFPTSRDDENDGDSEALDEIDWWESTTSDPAGCSDIHWGGAVHPMANWGSFAGLGRVGGLSLLTDMQTDPDNAPADFNHTLGGRILAHELGHNHGRNHIDCGGAGGPKDNPPFDECEFSSDDLDDPSTHFGFDPLTEQPLDPTASGDLLSYASTRWISAWNYQNILNDLVAGAGGAGAAGAGEAGPRLLVRGRVDESTPAATIGMAYLLEDGSYDVGKASRSEDAAAAAAADPANRWRFSIRDAAGAELMQLGVPFQLDTEGREDSFVQLLPFPPDAAVAALLFDGAVVTELAPSANAPVVTLEPPVVDPVAETLSLEWSASDADGDVLHFAVFYSADGVRWRTLRMDYPGLTATIPTTYLPGSSQARVRVVATDGLLTDEAVSDPFAVDDHDPMVFLAGVEEDERVPFGRRLELAGSGLDAEDGGLLPEDLDWELTGTESASATGNAFSLARLLPGPYTVELTGEDSSSRATSVSRSFEVDPLLVPESSEPQVDGLCGDGAYDQATYVEVPRGDGGFAGVRLVHHDARLFVCWNDLERFAGAISLPVAGALRVEIDGAGDASVVISDKAFLIDDRGILTQQIGGPGGFRPHPVPAPGVRAEVSLNPGGFGAELSIPDSALGGWDHPVSLQLAQVAPGGETSWPFASDPDSPATWAAAYFGTPPPAPNRPPVARAGADLHLDPLGVLEVMLDGTGSRDPDGDALTFAWTQVAGPAIALLNPTSAAPTLVVDPDDGAASYAFELVVNDGGGDSDPDEVAVHVRPSVPSPSRTTTGPQLPMFVPVGDPGNDPATIGGLSVGRVDVAYGAGTTEVTNAAYASFLNAVAQSDPHGLFSPEMESEPRGGIVRSGSNGSYAYAAKERMETKPVNFVSFFDAARFANWLENGAPQGPGAESSTENGSYDLGQGQPLRLPGATWVLGSEDEWVKAAYFVPGSGNAYAPYPAAVSGLPLPATASPTGNALNPGPLTMNHARGADWNAIDGNLLSVATSQAPSGYGTYDQGGNVAEWTDTVRAFQNGKSGRIVRGGAYDDTATALALDRAGLSKDTTERADIGFRLFRVGDLPGPDADGDGVPDVADNCTNVPNPDQSDHDAGQDDDSSRAGVQHYGDACDADLDDDGIVGASDFFGGLRPCLGQSPVGTCAEADLDGDGTIGASDFFSLFRPALGTAPGPGVTE